MSCSFPQYNEFTPLENYKTPYPNIPNHSAGSLPPFSHQQDSMMSPSPDSNGSSHSDSIISPSLDLFFQQRPSHSPPLMQQVDGRMGGNGLLTAYMRLEEQIKVLQNDILQLRMDKQMLACEAAYTKLAESLSLTPDHVALSTLSPQSLPVTLKAKEITVPSYNRADFPSEFIWTKEDWKKLQEKPSTQLEKSHPLRFVVDKNNKPIPLERVTSIRTTSRRVFVDIWNINEAPKSWGAASGSASKLYYREMVTFFPELGYCDGNWKCDAIATASYTSWCKNHINRLDREGTYKPMAEDIINLDNLETLDSDDTEGTDTKANVDMKTTKRRTRDSESLDARSNSSKKRKSSETSMIECTPPSLPVPEAMDSTSLSPVPDGNTPPDSEFQPTNDHSVSMITEPHAASSSKEMPTPGAPARFRARPLKFANPLTTLEPTDANRLPLIQPPPSEDIQSTTLAEEPISIQPTSDPAPQSSIILTPEHSPDDSEMVPNAHPPATIQVSADLIPTTNTTMVPLLVDASATSESQTSVPAKKSRKMQIGKAQNGRNLCAREWLTRNKTGSAAEFKTYYDGLSDGQKKSYNELAAKKVTAGEWPH
ncbi:hypothetical protein BDR04DRAFT_1153412 [Suillus decipiens]|nr:hypothetical protein BDR04DRAFT_1153412 [Suillus decipiens]